MLTNAQMTPNRFAKWHTARVTVARIQAHLRSQGVVVVATYTKATYYREAWHADLFKANRAGAWVKRGKLWDCIDGCAIKFGRSVVALEKSLPGQK